MATFEELFPDNSQEPFVPIETGRVNPQLRAIRTRTRQALDVSGGPDTSAFEGAFGDLLTQAPTAPEPADEGVGLADYGRAFVGGVGQLGAAAAGAGEYVASRMSREGAPFQQQASGVRDALGGMRRDAGAFSQSWFDSMSPEAQSRALREVTTLDPNRSIWQGGPGEFLSSVGLKMAGAAPSTVVTLLPGALIMRAGLTGGALSYLGASEGVLSLGAIASNIAQEVEQADEAELMQSPRYQAFRQSMAESEARQALIREAQGLAPVIGGLVVGAISATAGRYLEPVFADKAGGLASRFGRGFVSEAAQESGQSGAEQVAQNVAAQVFDTQRGTFEGVPEAVGQGALVGGALGGATLAAVGPRPQQNPQLQTAIPTGEDTPTPLAGTSPANAAPESFQSVFGSQAAPPGGWRGGDAEFGALPDIDSTGQRLLNVGPVDPAAQAALNARAEGLITDMFEREGQQTPQQEQQSFLQNPWPVTQTEMALPPRVTDVATTSQGGEQLPLGLRQRVRGGPPEVIQPTPAQPVVEDMSAPPGFSMERLPQGDLTAGRRPTRADFMRGRAEQQRAERYQGTVVDPRQQDMFGGQPALTPDVPSAEPIADLNAQLADLADPDSERLGVYLSPANMQQAADLPTVGVPLSDFDGKGGVLIAKNRQVANELLAMRDQGIEMQEILGLATGAGGGKPLGADIAVQQRDEEGNVVRESLVETPEEAETLAEGFDQPGREGVILSAGMAIKRRAQRIADEQKSIQLRQTEKRARRGVEDVVEATGISDTELEAGAKSIAVRFQSLKQQLSDAEKAQSDAPTRAERFKARSTAEQLREEMGKLRAVAEAEARRVRPKQQFPDARKSLEELPDEQLDKLPDEQVEELFREAANVAAGSRVRRTKTADETRETAEAGATTTFSPHGKTLEEIIAAHPARSQKLKLIGRVKRMLRRRAMGGKLKTSPITGKAVVRKGVGGSEDTAIRKSELRPTKAFDVEPPRELSGAERLKHNARVRKTFNTLEQRVQAFMARAQEFDAALTKQSQEREADGNPPKTARDAVYGRAYLNTLMRYGQLLQQLRPRSTAGLKEVERFNSLAEDLLEAKPDKFLTKLARATEAESDTQAKAAIRLDPTILKGMGTRRERRALAMDAAANIREKISRAKRLHDVWHKNAKFEQHVAPLMQKLIGYVTFDTSLANVASERRGLGYVPTFAEMRNLRYALRDFKATDKEGLYKPLKRWFEEYGYKFDESGDLVLAKNAAQFDYTRPEAVLLQGRDAMRGAPLNFNQKVAVRKAKQLKARMDAERARRAALTPAQRRQEDRALASRIEKDRRRGMSYEQRKALEALDRRSRTLKLELLDVNADVSSLRNSAQAVAAVLEQGTTPKLQDALRSVAATLPANHPYQALLSRLLDVNLADVVLDYGDTKGSFATFTQTRFTSGRIQRAIRINRPRLEEMRAAGSDPAPFFMHALMHESVHAATAGALANNARFRAGVWAIMRQARTAAQQQGIPLEFGGREVYGFRDNSVDEFIAEAFSNQAFQNLLREIKLEPNRSVWDVIVDLVKRLLGLADTTEATSVLDLTLATADSLFTGEAINQTRGIETTLNLKETPMAPAIGNVIDKVMQSSRVTRDIRERAKNTLEGNKAGGSRFLLSALTMEQIRDFYANNFGGGGGPLSEYMKAFFQRNADNSANMEQADKLSRRWTALVEQYGQEEGVNLSRLMTEATLYGIHPDEALQSKANEHVTSVPQKQRYADLAKRYRALNPEFRKLYHDVQTYFDESLRREVNLMTLNALRGAVEGEFKYTEEDITRKKLNTVEGMQKEFGDRLSDNERKIIARLARLPDMRVGPYFPLMRFGDYVVTAEKTRERKHFTDRTEANTWAREQRENDPTLSVSPPTETDDGWTVSVKEKEVRMAETPSEAEQNRQEMVAEYGAASVSQVQLKAQLYSRGAAIDSNSGLRTILGKLDGNPAAQAAIKDFYLRSLSDGAFRKREIKRANRRGVDYETQHRTFASYAKSSAYYTSQLRFGWKMADALIRMQKFVEETARGEHDTGLTPVRMGEVVREINTRDKLTHDHVEVSKIVRAGSELSQFMMLTSPSYWMINATQPYMVTLPWLAARTSIGEATAALTTAQKMIVSPIVNQMGESFGGLKALWSKAGAEKAFTVLEQVEDYIKQRGGARADEYIAMLNKLKRDSIIDLSFVAELRDIAEGQNTSLTQRVLDASRIMAHLTEVNNRIMTAIAAYDLYRNRGLTQFQSEEFAKQAVSLTQFNYSSGNAPRLFQARGPLGQMGPLVFQFMKYPQHMYALLIDNFRRAVWSGGMDRKIALKTLTGLFATHLAAGGLIGAMLQPVKWAIGLTMAAFGDDDEPYTVKNALSGETFDRMLRQATAELFGNEFGEILAAGAPRAAGVDLSNRMSLGTLYFIDMKTDTAESTIGSIVASFGGPLVNLGMGFWKGAQYVNEGQVSKGMEAFMPKMAKDVAKMIRYTSEGLTDATGKEIIAADKLSPWQLFAQSVGFQPAQVSEAYARRTAIKDAQSHDAQRRQVLLRRFQNAAPDERSAIIEEIREFNSANPAAGISRSQLLKSVQSFHERAARTRVFGVDLQGDDVLYEDEGDIYET